MPIKEISAESVRDKSIRHGHISTLHLWWARRPLPVCRAVIFASLVPDSRRLRAFEKISLEPGESKVVRLAVPATDLAFVNYDGKWTLEEGDFRIQVGDQVTMVHCNTTKVWDEPNID